MKVKLDDMVVAYTRFKELDKSLLSLIDNANDFLATFATSFTINYPIASISICAFSPSSTQVGDKPL